MNVLKRVADSREIFGILCRLSLWIGLLMIPGITAAQEQAKETDRNRLLEAMPEGYFLHAYDDCGVPQRQPRVRIERHVGFRQIEIRGSRLLVNGVPVKLAGTCRHEVDPLGGRANTMRHAQEDVRLIKAANLNYIRTSHYPPTMELVAAADKYGVYLEVEARFCWVGVREDLKQLEKVQEILEGPIE